MKLAIAATLLSLGASVAHAGIELITVETLMHAQAQEALALSIVAPASITRTLQYNFSVDSNTGLFDYQALSGQTYNGLNYSLSSQGTFDADTQTFTWVGSGMLGSQTWSQAGQAQWVGDPTATLSGSVSLGGNVIGTFSGTVVVNGRFSEGQGTFTPTGGNPSTYNVTDVWPSEFDQPWTLRWNDHEAQLTAASIVFILANENDGILQGTSTVTVTAVPEPSSFPLIGVCLLALLVQRAKTCALPNLTNGKYRRRHAQAKWQLDPRSHGDRLV